MIVTTLRIPKELHKQIEKLAKENRRSLNSQILIILEKYIEGCKSTQDKIESNP